MIRQILNVIGTAALVAAPYFMDTDLGKHLCITGFILLSVQSIHLKAHNLTLLNVLGVIGYTVALIK